MLNRPINRTLNRPLNRLFIATDDEEPQGTAWADTVLNGACAEWESLTFDSSQTWPNNIVNPNNGLPQTDWDSYYGFDGTTDVKEPPFVNGEFTFPTASFNRLKNSIALVNDFHKSAVTSGTLGIGIRWYQPTSTTSIYLFGTGGMNNGAAGFGLRLNLNASNTIAYIYIGDGTDNTIIPLANNVPIAFDDYNFLYIELTKTAADEFDYTIWVNDSTPIATGSSGAWDAVGTSDSKELFEIGASAGSLPFRSGEKAGKVVISNAVETNTTVGDLKTLWENRTV